jgi:hypothetical protein
MLTTRLAALATQCQLEHRPLAIGLYRCAQAEAMAVDS